jgi:LytS/YehU family sensor histidine kinase
MYLADIRVNNQVRPWTPNTVLQLRHSEQLIEFTFAGLFLTDQKGVRYRARVDDLHSDWTDLGGQRQIVLAGLPPGKFTFRAKAVTRGGVWSDEELVVPFVIRPPFYGTLAFRVGVISLMGALIVLGIRQRERTIRRRDRREAEINRKMSELEKRALQSQMNPHFIYNSMNSIQQFMIEQDIEGAMRYLTKFSRILRNVLNLSAQSRVPLTDEIDMIRDYLELERMRFPDTFAYRIDVDPAIPVHSLEIPPFLVQPQVENAIRHGLLRKGKPGHLVIRIRPEGPELLISVEDDGIGRAAAQQWKMHDPGASESRGLAIVQERLMHLHHGHADGTFTITDLFTPDGRPAGTRVDIKIPLD